MYMYLSSSGLTPNQVRDRPGDQEGLENTGFPIKDFGNDRIKTAVYNRH